MSAEHRRTPVALTVAGSDPSGGAGIQADLKTFSALGVYGTAALTALTAQNTRGVTGVHPVPARFVGDQVRTLLDDVEVHACKTGMLGTADVVREVAAVLARRVAGPVICDPVMVATSGDRLVAEDAVDAVRLDLLPVVDLVTPNVPEAAALLDVSPAPSLIHISRCRRSA
ncbi:hydroxymethylpyrimidine/phosphomethylpyrimidine kinase [Blastococcus atacamensis]|uniref:hydroxymethylpyrimidine/phosphomethylpyrimidine kinase n=1 Tax=Blastococcus atacamensis TaxID=2070508 RepID=UPI001E565746|nr:hydroxymethylpyrimidine/phosphomethylpyrimidine kinase [Blastococcus atacamensis]